MGWGLETTPQTLAATVDAPEYLATLKPSDPALAELYRKITCPVLVIHGERDQLVSPTRGAAVAKATGAEYVEIEDGGHVLWARQPVKVNLLIRDFVERQVARRPAATQRRTNRWPVARSRRRRALYISSPIGLGHAQRDVAIARELRKLRPDLEIDWLAQDPVTRVLAAEGERLHPASRFLASESSHIESESGEHDLHAFQAMRRMDEILVNNFMVFHDIVRDEPYDLWIGDEAWELDYFLHENPEQKRAPYVWMTDFVGWIPMPDGGDHEASITTDYNAEMIAQIARYPRLRDRSIFVGNPGDIVPETFGADLPDIADWTKKHFDFSGYITGFDPAQFADREALRAELGYKPGEAVCIVTVGGSGVGGPPVTSRDRSLPRSETPRSELAHDCGCWTTHRSGLVACRRGFGGPGVRASPLSSLGCVRHRGRARWSVDDHGAHREPATFLVLPFTSPLRAKFPRAPSPGALRCGPLHGLRNRDAGDHRASARG